MRTRKVFTGEFHADNHNEFLDYLREQIKIERPGVKFELRVSVAGGCVNYIENGVETGHFWHLPKLKKEVFGLLEIRSKDYRFLADGAEDYSYGSGPKEENLREYGFAIETKGGAIEYHIED